ncbi:MAG: cytochrome c biogenesis protein CcsA [Saprospiraceae bacterium]|nr:cytochrome c biogenesis protein CcsA [Saprospiraceae bacterium]MDW8228742.1 cytochrome c biogenesis protein CcsA [Saprospiraceae bacterium]
MQYIGEHLLPGQIGHLLAVLSFVAALLASVSYFLAVRRRTLPDEAGWRLLGRGAFVVHGLATLGIIVALFWILVNKYYEYQYAWANVSDDLPFQYTFSAFWKEQQGSFLLWSFWHIVLGMILLFRAGRWEAPVLTVLSAAEAFIGSMILGLYIGEYRLGVSAFDLLRHTMDAPIFERADYLSQITGNGLNPLLQNYWMTIHPPTLFLGFASTLVPFSYAIAGLWTGEHREWLKPALPWALFSAAILGLGILMGGAWAYVALSFGGYWAWDPVENTSLVPWITLVAGIHAHLIARNTGYSIRSAYAFYLMTFVLVLYSTYLTRSGILGDSSAHAFTEMGLGAQLIAFIGAFAALSIALMAARSKGIPAPKQEEAIASREFWMFIGVLVLLFSAVLITGATSLPVWNKLVQIFKPDYVGAALKDPVAHHNRYQLWIGVFVGLLTGVAQWLRYQERNAAIWRRTFARHMLIALVGAAALTALNALWLNVFAWQHFALLFAAMFAVVANVDYLITFLRKNLKQAGSALSHIGFGLLLLGILGTGLNKHWISSNSFAMEGLIEGMGSEELNKNVLLLKDAPMPIRGYEATYLKDTIERQTRTFAVRFRKRDAQGNPTGEEFVLYPNVMYDRQFSQVVASNPSTKHYLTYDIFTHVSSLPKAELDPEFARQQEDSIRFEAYEAAIGDTIFTKKHYLVLDDYTKAPQHPDYRPEKGDLAFGLKLRAFALDDTVGHAAAPMLYLRPKQGAFTLPAQIGALQMRVRLTEASLARLIDADETLQYRSLRLKEGESAEFEGYRIQLVRLNRNVEHPHYTPEAGDIAVTAELLVTAPDGATAKAAPVFLIRDSRSLNLKDEVAKWGLHFRFENIEPSTATMTILAARASAQARRIPVEIAENAPRSDYIVLEAIVFPGINLVWLGSLLMLFGLGLSAWHRWTQRLRT